MRIDHKFLQQYSKKVQNPRGPDIVVHLDLKENRNPMWFVSLLSPADVLTAVLTKINRLDIVTLLEGPIFDYGNISGTRCFADDNAVFPDQFDGKV